MAETKNTERLDALFNDLVPDMGKAESMAGELVRATARIGHRFFNDGDWIGVGYGRETCNPAARFLAKHGNKKIAAYIKALWGLNDDNAYEEILDALVGAVAGYVEGHPELRDTETEDMFDCRNPKEDVDFDEGYDGELD